MIKFEGFDPTFLSDKEVVEATINQIAKDHGFVVKELEIKGLTDKQLLEINKAHLNHDTYTDIITFDYCRKGKLKGEIFMSLERVNENRLRAGASFSEELKRVIFHGVLHLVGYKDKSVDDKLQMTSKEDYYLSLRA